MLTALFISGMLAASEPDIIITEPPVPTVEGAENFIACGRLNVSIRYQNVWQKGVQRLDGRMSYARQGKSMADALGEIQRQVESIYRVKLFCAGDNAVRAEVEGVLTDGESFRRWVLSIDEKLDIAIKVEEANLSDFR